MAHVIRIRRRCKYGITCIMIEPDARDVRQARRTQVFTPEGVVFGGCASMYLIRSARAVVGGCADVAIAAPTRKWIQSGATAPRNLFHWRPITSFSSGPRRPVTSISWIKSLSICYFFLSSFCCCGGGVGLLSLRLSVIY